MAFELTPFGTFGELRTLRDEMEKTWNQFFKAWPSVETFRGEWVPSLDVSETKDEVVVRAEVPGIDAKDIDVTLKDGLLTIKGEKKAEKEEKGENHHLTERRYGSFSRSVRLPFDVHASKIKANYKDGLLTITMPKSEKSKVKQIKVNMD